MDERSGDRPLRDAVKLARSNFYESKFKKKKLTRKDTRKNQRLDKKKKQLEFQLKKVGKFEVKPKEEVKKKKKKRRKRKVIEKVLEEETVIEEDTVENFAKEAANKRDDQIINELGKKLRVNKRAKLPSIFTDDGLDYLLEVCEPLTNENYDNESDEEYLAQKSNQSKNQKKSKKLNLYGEDDAVEEDISNKLLFEDGTGVDEEDVSNDDNESESGDEEMEQDGLDDDFADLEGDDESDSEEEVEDEISEETDEAKSDIKEVSAGKYIPPALRNLPKVDVDKEKVNKERIKRQLKGLLNRVSETTLPAIMAEIEKLYSKNSRNNMNEILFMLISEACITTSKMPDRLIIEHMLIIAALHTSIGVEVGSYALEMLAERFHASHALIISNPRSKELHNIVFMLANLYICKVVHCSLIVDIVRRFLQQFHEQDIEMILMILKACGAEIRRDDPATLKEMILEVQSKAVSSELKDQSRVRFMLDIITALKNNNLRKIPQYDVTVVEDMKKLLKQINHGKDSLNSGVQLKLSLDDLLNVKEKGRWWIVGSAWSGRGPTNQDSKAAESTNEMTDDHSSRLLELAKKQRMNTNLRKSIFCTIMTSEDYMDAFEKLLKLNLKEKQAREIIHVLVDCCLQEKAYNPFYAHLSDKFCEYTRSNQVTLQYTLWDRFKVLSTLSKHSTHNLSKFLAHSVASQSLSLAVLKVVSFGVLDKSSIRFFIRFFNILLLEYPEHTIVKRFQHISNNAKLTLLREGIKIFLRHFLLPPSTKDNEVTNERKKEIIEKCEAAIDGRSYAPVQI